MSTAPEIDGFADLVPIGRGAVGTVFRATSTATGEPVAIKVLDETTRKRSDRKRFEESCKSLISLEHPNLVAVRESGYTHTKQAYVVMELCQAGSLGALLQREGPLAVDEACRLVGEIAAALVELHARDMVHGDVKPGNMLLDDDGHAKLADLGPAVSLEPSSDGTTGTPEYASPEQLQTGRPTPEDDVYSLGATFYTLISGRPPFPLQSEDHLNRALRLRRQGMPGFVTVVPPRIIKVIEKSISADREDRYPSAAAFVDALASSQRPDDGRDDPPMPLMDDSATRVLPKSPDEGDIDAGARPTSPDRMPARVLIGATGLAVLLVLGATAWTVLTDGKPSKPAPGTATSVAGPPLVLTKTTLSADVLRRTFGLLHRPGRPDVQTTDDASLLVTWAPPAVQTARPAETNLAFAAQGQREPVLLPNATDGLWGGKPPSSRGCFYAYAFYTVGDASQTVRVPSEPAALATTNCPALESEPVPAGP